jgi:hypothetical protein
LIELRTFTGPPRAASLPLLVVLALSAGGAGAAAQTPAALRPCTQSAAAELRTATTPLEAELAQASAEGASFILRFKRTKLDAKAEAVARVALRGRTLYVRVCAAGLPLPSRWKEQRYSLWVYLSNYEERFHIGDLPVAPRPARDGGDGVPRGDADSTFRFGGLPPGAVFGGLVLTAEPARYTPIPNEPLRPVLVAPMSGWNPADANAAGHTDARPGEK